MDQADLPVDLTSHLEDYKPHGRPEPPLAKADDDWLYPVIDESDTVRNQYDATMGRVLLVLPPIYRSGKPDCFVDPEKEQAWMPVDLYIGGTLNMPVLHLLYARFWHKVLYDRGHVTTKEPFQRLINRGMILEMEFTVYQDADNQWIGANEVSTVMMAPIVNRTALRYNWMASTEDRVSKKGDTFVLAEDDRVDGRSLEMSKSRGNVINPDEIVDGYGADSLRLYEMFMGPYGGNQAGVCPV